MDLRTVIFWLLAALLGASGGALALWALAADRARGRRRCPRCWHAMDRAGGLRCPECGRLARSEAGLLRTRRRWRLALVGLAVAGCAYPAWLGPRVLRDGWAAHAPTTALIVAWPWAAPTNSAHARRLAEAAEADGLAPWQERLLVRACRLSLRRRSDAEARLGSLRILREFAHDAAPAVPEAIGALDDPDPNVSTLAAAVIGDIATDPAAAAPALARALSSSDAKLRHRAASSLWALSPGASAAAPALGAALSDRDAAVRRCAAHALFVMGETGVPHLAAAIRSGTPEARGTVFEALDMHLYKLGFHERPLAEVPAWLGPIADACVTTLVDAGGNADGRAVGALESLRQLGPPALVRALRDANPRLRSVAAAVLGTHAFSTREHLGPLSAMLADRDGPAREAAGEAAAALAARLEQRSP